MAGMLLGQALPDALHVQAAIITATAFFPKTAYSMPKRMELMSGSVLKQMWQSRISIGMELHLVIALADSDCQLP